MNTEQIMKFVQGGNSTFTLRSKNWKLRYTYNVKIDKNDCNRFIAKVLFGPDNTKDYRYLGLFYRDNVTLRVGKLTTSIPRSDHRFSMLKVFLELLCTEKELPYTCEFYPSGRCGRCGRKLTSPESIERGFGPSCWEAINE